MMKVLKNKYKAVAHWYIGATAFVYILQTEEVLYQSQTSM